MLETVIACASAILEVVVAYVWALCKVVALAAFGVFSVIGVCIVAGAVVTFVAAIWYIEVRFRRSYRKEYRNLHNK